MTDIEKRAYEAYPKGKYQSEEYTNLLGRKGYIKCAEEYESLPKIHGCVARDKDGYLKLWQNKPQQIPNYGWDGDFYLYIDEALLPELHNNSEPVEVELLIRKVESTKQV